MQFSKGVYRIAKRRALNEVFSRADILQWAKDYADKFLGNQDLVDHLDAMQRVDEARTEYFRSLDLAQRIVARGRREGKLK